MKIAIEGCAHGELDKIYESIEILERKENVKIDLLICCGDFQSTRNLYDLQCMAVPQKYQDICTFYKYYSGEKVAPYLTIFIGGNHEASNYLQELPYGGWVAPNIYYLGYAGVINIAGVRIGGISGIYKGFDYLRGHHEKAPYDESAKRSVYHIRNIEVFRLKQLSGKLDIILSHDWPKGITRHGNQQKLLKNKPFFKDDIESGKLGSPPCEELLNHLKPKYWFAAHLHCKFAALVRHSDATDSSQKTTKFLALDKCLPRRKFLQIVDIPHDPDSPIEIKYDLEWLTILFLTNHLLSIKNCNQYMPGPNSPNRWVFTPTQEEKDFVLEKINYDLTVPKNFVPSVPAYSPNDSKSCVKQPCGQTNIQTKLFCDKLSIDDPTYLVLSLNGDCNKNESFNDSGPINNSTFNSFTKFIPSSVEIKYSKLNLSLPEPKNELLASPKLSKLNLTLPAPKHNLEDLNCSSNTTETSSQESESDSSLNISNLSDCDIKTYTSTPQSKKFKRRNESIYKITNDF